MVVIGTEVSFMNSNITSEILNSFHLILSSNYNRVPSSQGRRVLRCTREDSLERNELILFGRFDFVGLFSR